MNCFPNVCNKRNKLWIGCAVNHKQAGILAWVIGDRSAETFKPLWLVLRVRTLVYGVTSARLHRKTLLHLVVSGDAEVFTPLTVALFEVSDSPSPCLNHYPFSNAEVY